MFPLTEWLDRDDVTEDDLVPLTAELEVYDWIRDTPVPDQQCPDWLPRHEWQPRLQRRSVRPRARAAGIAWGWVAGTLVVAAILALSFMASAVGVAFVTFV
ncbi:MAG: hypothetical protein H6737_03475 [Alphaproteobacteria bacterium]|nr:hypothetical protein [Alphaproteobacteria bacterium]